MVFTVTMNPSYDYFVRMPHLKVGEINRAEEEKLFPGGKGINVSIVLHQLGVKTYALGFIAGFIGDALEQHLHVIGIPTSLIRLPKGETRINVKIKSEAETAVNGAGPEVPPEKIEELFRKFRELDAGDVLVLSGNVPPTLPKDTYARALQSVQDCGFLTVVDATGETLRSVLPHRPFLIKPNDEELGELFGRRLSTTEEIEEAARALQGEGARNVLVSRAGEGALLLTEEGEMLVKKPPEGRLVSSVAAGDSMVAGFLAGWLSTKNYAEAFDLGLAAGSATAFCEWIARKPEILRLLKEIKAVKE